MANERAQGVALVDTVDEDTYLLAVGSVELVAQSNGALVVQGSDDLDGLSNALLLVASDVALEEKNIVELREVMDYVDSRWVQGKHALYELALHLHYEV
jgi:hypothetical protein